MAGKPREKRIVEWVERIERSRLSARQYLARYCVPFSLAQYYRYRDAHRRHGIEGLVDGRSQGNSRVIPMEAEGFLLGYVCAHQDVTLKDLRKVLRERFDIEVSPWGLNKCLCRLGIGLRRPAKAGESRKSWTPFGVFQLVLALGWYCKWPQATAEVIQKAMAGARRSKRFATAQSGADLQGRNRRGEFTARYNRRLKVREQRFESVEVKRRSKSLPSMDLFKVGAEALARNHGTGYKEVFDLVRQDPSLAASLPGCGCLVCGFCPSGRDFAYSFLQIPDHSGHPCCSANGSRHQGP